MSRFALAAVVIALVVVGSSAGPIIVRHDRDDEAYLELGRRFGIALAHMNLEVAGEPPDGEGTLIDPRWVLTAAHVGEEVDPGHGLTVDGRDYAAERVVLHPEWDGGARNDIALIELARPVPSVAPVGLYSATDEVGRVVVVVGRGDSGTGLTGPTVNDRRVRGATNRVDGADPDLIWWRFDAPDDSVSTRLEGISGPGDSGGPALIDVDGTFRLAGVSSAQSTRATGGREGVYGVTEYYVRVSSHVEWIGGIIAEEAEDADEGRTR